jgi:hypothetical protein
MKNDMKTKSEEYAEERKTPEWQALSARILERDPICTCCHSRESTISHHFTYAYGCLAPENMLIGVCIDCHAMIHWKPKKPTVPRIKFYPEQTVELPDLSGCKIIQAFRKTLLIETKDGTRLRIDKPKSTRQIVPL